MWLQLSSNASLLREPSTRPRRANLIVVGPGDMHLPLGVIGKIDFGIRGSTNAQFEDDLRRMFGLTKSNHCNQRGKCIDIGNRPFKAGHVSIDRHRV